MIPICPHCGYNLERDRPVTDGAFRYDPSTTTFEVAGEAMPCSRQMREMLGGVLIAGGRTLTYDAIAARMGYEGDAPQRLIQTLASRARRLIEARGHIPPFLIVYGTGMRWTREPHSAANEHRGARQ